jgi:hypothetical protein
MPMGKEPAVKLKVADPFDRDAGAEVYPFPARITVPVGTGSEEGSSVT